ncbi:MAG: helix-turn-helix domain-containing protein [Halanaerobiales bacterium]
MKYYDPSEVASILKIKPMKVFQLIGNDQLKCVQMGSNYRIKKDDLSNFVKRYHKRG